MREIRQSGSEGEAIQANVLSLPLSDQQLFEKFNLDNIESTYKKFLKE
jgi:hypothetical protein